MGDAGHGDGRVVHDRLPPLDSSLRVRIAPAPSGELHVGNVRAALFNWALARRHGGTFVLRVEDTDASRVTDAFVAAAQRDLSWVGLDWDEGPGIGGPCAPYRQSERLEIYREAVDRLLASGAAYRAFDTPAELAAARAEAAAEKRAFRYDGSRWRALPIAASAARAATGEPFVVRLSMPPGSTTWSDLVRGQVTIEHAEIADVTLTRVDSSPLYMLAASVDDIAMGLTHIVRGEDLISAVPRQLALYAALGHPRERWPAFAHLPLVNGPDGKPLSKRNGETSLTWYRDAGFLPEAVLNYLGQLGWSLPVVAGEQESRELFTVHEMVAGFSLERVQRNPAQFDLAKLEALNGQWLRRLPLPELGARVRPWLAAAGVTVPDELLDRALPELASRLHRLSDAAELLRPLATVGFAVDEGDAAALLVAEAVDLLTIALDVLADDGLPWGSEAILAVLRAAMERLGRKPRQAFPVLYVAVAGRRSGYPLTTLMELLGRAVTLARLRAALERAGGAARA